MTHLATILHKMSTSFLASEENQRLFRKYDVMQKDPGWPVFQGLMVSMGNGITEYMLSKEFTKLDKEEKDAQQRAFYHTKEIIDFLIDPLKGARKYAAIKQHNKKMEATTSGATRKGVRNG